MTGYSGTPLLKKLGLKEGMRAVAFYPSKTLLEAARDAGIRLDLPPSVEDCPGGCNYIHIFLKERVVMESSLRLLKNRLEPDGMIWVSWPKKAAKVDTEVGEADIRQCGLGTGLVDIKICAVDEVWSGLKFVIPVKDRRAQAS